MKKYWFLMTSNTVWLDVAISLYEKKIAQPVLWLGDDVHYSKAREVFGEDVLSMLNFVHYQLRIKSFSYEGEYSDFFFSENYLRAKDRCLKMMDRLDLYGVFARQDREIVFNKLACWFLKKIEDSRPDALVMAEFAHTHAQYLAYEICDYVGLEIVKFNTLMPVPLLFLQNVRTGSRQKTNLDIDKDLLLVLREDMKSYVCEIADRKEEEVYEITYMKKQRLQATWKGTVINFFKSGWFELAREIWFQTRMYFKNEYYQINPYKLGISGRSKIKRLRKKNLLRELNKNQDSVHLKKKYVYFALHYEPERTTNPDGGTFHDQVLAIIALRKKLPVDVDIIVKEHPSQFYFSDRGSRGRSPLFYEFIKNIKGVKLSGVGESSQELIKNSLLVATISGSAALEAAIMQKKSIIFGDAWFNGCPNVTTWSEDLSLESLLNKEVFKLDRIFDFLYLEMDLYGVPGCQNGSAQKRLSNYSHNFYLKDNFFNSEKEGVFHLMNNFFKGIT